MASLLFLGMAVFGGLKSRNCLEQCGEEDEECINECHNEKQQQGFCLYIHTFKGVFTRLLHCTCLGGTQFTE